MWINVENKLGLLPNNEQDCRYEVPTLTTLDDTQLQQWSVPLLEKWEWLCSVHFVQKVNHDTYPRRGYNSLTGRIMERSNTCVTWVHTKKGDTSKSASNAGWLQESGAKKFMKVYEQNSLLHLPGKCRCCCSNDEHIHIRYEGYMHLFSLNLSTLPLARAYHVAPPVIHAYFSAINMAYLWWLSMSQICKTLLS